MSSNLKKQAFAFVHSYSTQKVKNINNQLSQLVEALNSETKSTAGDKHETGRAMLQLEREKLGNQLADAEKSISFLHRINLEASNSKVGLGSLVFTSNGNYFISVFAGKYQVNNRVIFCISNVSPIGQLLMGKSEDDRFEFNNKEYEIRNVY
ncbi:hypothetical protein GCM10011414_04690 [Croceivirga lutea]|uniref:GreA/GreB family elongation factor n=1 Tax=Croceivirga lutea TaxID=1775167 RepID=UPI00163A6702|nr:GreA/GreB family elongation factor [Croceivirga lutea]GGG38444.1 hypothetical protein GCM10011414_04690 [Croceivirga lutea]